MTIAIRVKPVAGVTRCAWCHEAAAQGRVCPSCSTRLHFDCAQAAGTCPTLGCSRQIALVSPRRRQRERAREQVSGRVPRSAQPLTTRDVVLAELFGVVLPLLCLAFDFIVFRGDRAWFGSIAGYAYPLIATQMVFLQAGLFWRDTEPEGQSFLGGALLVGWAFALVLGILLLPLTLLGLVLGIGLLGLSPFLTQRAFGRVAWRCFGRLEDTALGPACLGVLTALLVPVLIGAGLS